LLLLPPLIGRNDNDGADDDDDDGMIVMGTPGVGMVGMRDRSGSGSGGGGSGGGGPCGSSSAQMTPLRPLAFNGLFRIALNPFAATCLTSVVMVVVTHTIGQLMLDSRRTDAISKGVRPLLVREEHRKMRS